MRKIEVKIRQIIWAINQSLKPTTYDLVEYKNEKYYIKSSLTGEDIWNLSKKGDEKPTHYYIKGKDLKVVHSLKRFKNVFKHHMFFQWSSWQKIDCCNPIGSRLSYISSENIRFMRSY